MRESLCAYQRQGIEFVVAKQGRALIADDMGLGKSVQALGAAVCMQGWPLLIICPATMRLVWAEECERWLPKLTLVLMVTCVTSTKVRILTRGERRQTSTSSSPLLTSFRETHQKS
jgi:SNF2 family DNA or RNA helicase